eukprot:gene3700-4220_t
MFKNVCLLLLLGLFYTSIASGSTVDPVEVIATDSTSLTVTWTNVSCSLNETISIASRYQIFYGATSLSNVSSCSSQNSSSETVTFESYVIDANLTTSVNDTLLSFVISNLSKWTCYQVKIIRISDTGESCGSNSSSVFAATLEDGPTKPRDVKSVAKSPWVVEISWIRPKYFHGDFQAYRVGYKKVSSTAWVTLPDTINTKVDVSNLQPFTGYLFRVVCVSSGGTSDFAETNTTTKKASPRPPTAIPATVTINPTHETFVIRLQEFSNINGFIKFYWICVYEVVAGKTLKSDPNGYKNSELKHFKDKVPGFPYITANLKSIPRGGMTFVVGDGETYSNTSTSRKRISTGQDSYVNGKLNPGSEYRVFQRAFVSDTLFSSSKWYGPFYTGPPPKSDDPTPLGPVVGGVVSVLVIAVIAGAYFIYRRSHAGDEKPEPPNELELRPVDGAVRGRDNVEFEEPIPVAEFQAHCQRLMENSGFLMFQEYSRLPPPKCMPYKNSTNVINSSKNRYNNIYAYDHSRVILRLINNEPGSDYINANYIDGYKMPATYIACQGPLFNTCEDHWRMVWEQDISIIVMMMRCGERGKKMCEQYWPLSGPLTFGTIQVSVSESTQFPNFTMSDLSILYSREPGKEKFVQHFHFTSWPHHGVPVASSFLTFLRRVNEKTPPKSGPILVHCSAGVGRTGTYIMLDVCLKRIAAENNVDVYGFLRRIRNQRNYLVQTESQYEFIHKAILEHLECGCTEVVAQDLKQYIRNLQSIGADGRSNLEHEFRRIERFPDKSDNAHDVAMMMCNRNKNRFVNIHPYDDTRVKLRMMAGVPGSDYINANFVEGYNAPKAYIATQAPLPNTVDDFWRMVYEQQCSTIVCLIRETNAQSSKMNLHVYWPDKDILTSGPLLIEKLKEDKQLDFTVRDFKLTNSQRGISRILRHFQFTAWPDAGLPENGACLVDFLGQVERWQQNSGNGKIVVHCNGGAGRTGVFITILNVIDRLKTEGFIDIFQTVKCLRSQRPAMVEVMGQYMFCFLVIQDYLASYLSILLLSFQQGFQHRSIFETKRILEFSTYIRATRKRNAKFVLLKFENGLFYTSIASGSTTVDPVEVIATDSTSLAVTWTNVSCSLNETISISSQYQIFYGATSLTNASSCSSQNSSSKTVTFESYVIDANLTTSVNDTLLSFVIPNLSKWTCYQVKVIRISDTGKSCGSNSSSVFAATLEDDRRIIDTVRSKVTQSIINFLNCPLDEDNGGMNKLDLSTTDADLDFLSDYQVTADFAFTRLKKVQHPILAPIFSLQKQKCSTLTTAIVMEYLFLLAPTAAPRNFTVTNESATSLSLIWESPITSELHGFIRHYLIKYTTVECGTGAEVNATIVWKNLTVGSTLKNVSIGNLTYWTCYSVSISAVTVGEGPFAIVKSVRTSEYAPTSAPRNFTVTNESATSLSLIWESPITSELHGFLRYYLIKYTTVECGTGAEVNATIVWKNLTVGSTLKNVSIGNLTYWTCYSVSISAVTVGEGPFAIVKSVRTSEYAPTSAPRNFTVTNESATSLSLIWESPITSELHGFIRYYLIKYTTVECETGAEVNATIVWKNLTVGSTLKNVSIGNLTYWTCYSVSISAVTVGEGPFAIVKSVRTSEYAPTSAPRNFTVTNESATSLSLTWEAPIRTELHGFIRYYLIKYATVECGTGTEVNATIVWKNLTVGSTLKNVSIGNLTYWTCYSVSISAVTVGEGPFANVMSVRTSEHAPTSAPRNFTVTNESATSLSLTWEAPIRTELHGFIRYYLIKYTTVECGTGTEVNATIVWKNLTVGSTLKNVSIGNLTYWTCYSVSISAVTVGEGPFAIVKSVRTSEYAPTSAPRNFTVTNESATSLSLIWESPITSELHGFIRYYLIKYTTVECGTGTEVNATIVWKNLTVGSTLKNVSIGNLTYWTCYSVSISAVTVGEGPFAIVKSVRTSEHAPTSAPRNFTVTNESATSLSLTWEAPIRTELHGFIRYYLIKYATVECGTGTEVNATIVWKNLTVGSTLKNVSIGNLTYWTCYSVRISAVTVGEGPFANVMSVRTSEHAPTSAPRNFTVTNESATSLSLTWEAPIRTELHGFIRYYLIKYTTVECGTGTEVNATIVWKNLTVGSTLKNVSIGNLTYWTCYSVSISAVTVGEGPFANVMSVRTSEHAPTSAPRNFTVTNESATSLSLIWESPITSELHGFIRYYLIKYTTVECGTGTEVNATIVWKNLTVGSTLKNVSIGNLTYWTCYSVSISAVTVGEGPFAIVKSVRTSEHAPTSAPRNFTVTNESATSLSLTWEAPIRTELHGFIRYYLIKYATVECGTGTEVNATIVWKNLTVGSTLKNVYIGNLTYWTCYSVSISAVTVGEGPFANVMSVRTSEHAPTSAPRNFTVTNESATSLSLTWEAPIRTELHGFIRYYLIKYTTVECGTGTEVNATIVWKNLTVGSTLKNVSIGNLTYWTCYSVSISALTVGEGPFANVMSVRTSEHAPTSAPRNFTVTNESATSLSLTWEAPIRTELHGFIRYYLIKYTTVECGTGTEVNATIVWKNLTVGSTLKNVSIGNLTYWTCYSVSISAVTVGEGPFANVMSVRTSEHAPTSAPRNFTVTNESATSLSLIWESPITSELHGFIRYYLIKYTTVECETGAEVNATIVWKNLTVGSTLKNVSIGNLTYWTCYSVSISAVTVGEGPFAIVKSVRTSEYAPTSAPRNFTVTNESATSLSLTWEAPIRTELHGFIRYYLIKYTTVECGTGTEVNATIVWKNLTVGSTLKNVSIGNLTYWTCYSVSISAVTVGEGPFANVMSVRTSEHAPTSTPRNFTVTNESATSLSLTWEAPIRTELHGFIRYYLIKYTTVECGTGTEVNATIVWKNLTVGSTLKNVSIGNLTYWTCYSVSISAVTVGEGPFANVMSVRTSEHAPTSAPRNFTVTNESATSLSLTWEAPIRTELHGFIRYYLIKYTTVECGTGTEVNATIVWKNLTVGSTLKNVSIGNLTYWTCYSVSISAVTVGEGPFANVMSVRTSEHAPTSAPRNFTVTNESATSLSLIWESPITSELHGFIRYYLIKYTTVECETGAEVNATIVWKNLTVGSTLKNVSIGNLTYWTCYSVSISAVTVGEGPFAIVKSVRTSEYAPTSAPRNFTVTNESATSLSLTWEAPIRTELHGFIRYYLIKYTTVECGTGTEVNATIVWKNLTVGSTLKNVSIGNLTYWTCYSVSISAVTVGEGPFANVMSVRTSEHAPTSAPRNFTVTNESATSLSLTWEAPIRTELHGFIRYYLIKYTTVECGTGTEVNATIVWKNLTVGSTLKNVSIGNLTYWTCYSVSISAVTVGEGPFANVMSVRTSEHAPTSAPRNFTVTNESATSLSLTWEAPIRTELHGFIRYYLIKYTTVECGTGTEVNATIVWKNLTVGSTLKNVSIGNLTYWTCYSVSISAVTVGEGPFANVMSVRTSEHAPTSAPRNFTVTNESATSLSLIWEAPIRTELHGFIRYYLIKYTKVECGTGAEVNATIVWKNLTVGSTLKNVSIGNLTYWTCYSVSISAVTVGEGPFANVMSVRTSEHAPTSAPRNFTVTNESATSLSLIWESPITSELHGFIRYYLIKYTTVECGTGAEVNATIVWKNLTVGSTLKNVSIGNLTFWTCYSVNISAVTVGEGPFANFRKMRTSEHAPTSAPESFYAMNASSSSLRLTWLPPLESNTHGVIRYFLFKYGIVDCHNVTSVREPIVWNYATRKFNLRMTTLSNLKLWTCYNVSIAAVTVKAGPFTAWRFIRTSEDAPTKPPVIDSVRNSTSTSLLVKWQPPPFEHQNGIIRDYRVYYRETNCVSGPVTSQPTTRPAITTVPAVTTVPTVTTVSTTTKEGGNPEGRGRRSIVGNEMNKFTSDTSLSISGLNKWTCYSVRVTCITVKESEKSNPVVNRTSEDKPEAPSFTSCQSLTSTSIKLVWNEPTVPNGYLRHYHLRWVYNGTHFSDDFRNGDEILDASKKEFNLTGLRFYSNYTFTLNAQTSAGWGATTTIKCATEHDRPTKPRDVTSVAKSPWVVEISWIRPKYFHGDFQAYRVTYKKVSSTGWATLPDTINTKVDVSNLQPFTGYLFRVVCVSSGGTSDFAETNTTTKKASPRPPTAIPATVTIKPTHETFVIRLQEFSNINGPIKFYWICVYEVVASEKLKSDPNGYKNSELKHFKDKVAGLPYITANLKSIPPGGRTFVVGDGKTYSNTSTTRKRRSTGQDSYVNGKLNPGSEYRVFQRAFVSDTLFSSSQWYGPFYTGPAPTKKPNIVGPVVGGVVSVLVIAAIAGAFLIYRRRHAGDEKPEPPNELELRPVDGAVRGRDNVGFEEPIPVAEFQAHCQRLMENSGRLMSEEYSRLPPPKCMPYENSANVINSSKNRYNNIHAYDHSRVILRLINNEPGSDYINANYIDGYKMPATYIACQGPLLNTCEDHWRMVWEQGVSMIIMVTKCVEKEKNKCEQYWPLSGSLTFGTIQVSVSQSIQFQDFTMSELSILYSREPGKEKFVQHFHFTAWPDHGVPVASSLLTFLRRVNEKTPPKPGPILVHCSAGVGRTGTYILLDVCLKRIAAENNVDVYGFLRRIRNQRNYLVQTESQYEFIHKAILEHLGCGCTEVVAQDLRQYIRNLQSIGADGKSNLEHEFRRIERFPDKSDNPHEFAMMMCNRNKNRFLNIHPYDKTRVKLRMMAGVPGSDYINANFVEGYNAPEAYIATQAPLPNTVDDFWRMVYEQQCSTIVCLIRETNAQSSKMNLHVYWPEEEIMTSGPLLIEKLNEDRQLDFTVRDFKLTNSQRGNSRILRHFQFTAWPDAGLPESEACFSDFLGKVEKWQQQSGNGKIVVHCNGGAGRTGVFITILYAIDRLKTEGFIDIFQTVKRLRSQRPAMVQVMGQYMFCFLVIQDYLASFEIYSNYY